MAIKCKIVKPGEAFTWPAERVNAFISDLKVLSCCKECKEVRSTDNRVAFLDFKFGTLSEFVKKIIPALNHARELADFITDENEKLGLKAAIDAWINDAESFSYNLSELEPLTECPAVMHRFAVYVGPERQILFLFDNTLNDEPLVFHAFMFNLVRIAAMATFGSDFQLIPSGFIEAMKAIAEIAE